MEVEDLFVEWAPKLPSEYLGDKTRIDVLVVIRTPRGREVVAVEVKYSDRFDSRNVDITTEPYQQIAAEFGLWGDTDLDDLRKNCNQLARCDALAMALASEIATEATPPTLLVIHHDLDEQAVTATSNYMSKVAAPERVHAVKLSRLLSLLRLKAQGRAEMAMAADLQVRYGSERLSEPLWVRSLGSRNRQKQVEILNADGPRRAATSLSESNSKVLEA